MLKNSLTVSAYTVFATARPLGMEIMRFIFTLGSLGE